MASMQAIWETIGTEKFCAVCGRANAALRAWAEMRKKFEGNAHDKARHMAEAHKIKEEREYRRLRDQANAAKKLLEKALAYVVLEHIVSN